MQCTEAEVCSWFGVTDKTLVGWIKRTYKMDSFSEIFDVKRQAGFTSLRRAQFKLAEVSPAMAIFLGKNYLGQTDKKEEKVEIGSDGFLEALHATAQTINEMSDIIES